ncbi:helix-turn-helix domain-containing protein [Colwellia hornerae]|uniref:Response regulator transcription factor n=1 Tax=Colwellia hornerae TaxID=89402 RepID=A0A5C6Q3S5_9GAMM|nr:winged helix-turn-helix domain-containing protein [Colwellia hornerae]TWX47409.1 response regulator transcription factor [Colwellia hornerae]TWX54689.1 response regulator transcription factor [Colwellia hornerae]TWX63402.1 response regulator transcription factor [Colwellia hornerae]
MLISDTIIIADVEIFMGSREVYCCKRLVTLTGLEFNLLWLLMSDFPQLVTRESIAEHIFKRSLADSNRSINMHISTIRKKLLVNTDKSRIKSFRGEGYVF